ncbi:ZIP family metal transporter [Pseudoduganella sp. LjRoot289]|uniref:ZIP family metal transporter n=1 Tax=Pseudoduganella sp. LjRoot289 TaxID=3342314 RepID=UPI003ECDC34E
MRTARASTPWRAALGWLVCAAGVLLLARDAVGALSALPGSMRGALTGGLFAALATAAGTLPVLLAQKVSQRLYDAALGLGAGIMLAATAFSLVIPAIAASKAAGATPLTASLVTAGGIALGMLAVLLLERAVEPGTALGPAPAVRELERERDAVSLRRAWLFVAAVAIHNVPEGLAIGVGYAGVDALKAHSLATGIAIQDIPEGLVVAMALRAVGYGRVYSTVLGALSGVPEPLAAIAGALLIDYSAALLPWGLAGAAGAMLFVICHEVVPAAHRNGACTGASCALVAGFIVMMVLDTALA